MQRSPFFTAARVGSFEPPPIGSIFAPAKLVGRSLPRFISWSVKLSRTAKAVYGALLWRANVDGIATPSLAHLAHEVGGGTTAVENAISALIRSSLIRRTQGPRRSNGTREVNTYQFVWSRHWQLAWMYQRLLSEGKGKTDSAVRIYELLIDHPQPGSAIAREEATTWHRHRGREPNLTGVDSGAEAFEMFTSRTGDGPYPENVEENNIGDEGRIAEIIQKWTLFQNCMAPVRTDIEAVRGSLKKYPAERVANILDYYIGHISADQTKVLGEALSDKVVNAYEDEWWVVAAKKRIEGDDVRHPERFGVWWPAKKKIFKKTVKREGRYES